MGKEEKNNRKDGKTRPDLNPKGVGFKSVFLFWGDLKAETTGFGSKLGALGDHSFWGFHFSFYQWVLGIYPVLFDPPPTIAVATIKNFGPKALKKHRFGLVDQCSYGLFGAILEKNIYVGSKPKVPFL